MEFRVLGPLEVIGPGGPIDIPSARQRAILALLVLNIGETVARDRLIDELWGDDPPPTAQHALGVHVAGLRRRLGAESLETQPRGYRLRETGSQVDLGRFEGLVHEGLEASTAGDSRAAARTFRAALKLWRGPALSDLGTGHAGRAERSRLDELRYEAMERWIDAELASGRHLDVVPDLRRIVAEAPLREGFQARLMLALYRSGRQSEALAVYHAARELLDRELGVDPGRELEEIQVAVLAHDSTLELAPGTEFSGPAGKEAETTPQFAAPRMTTPSAIDRPPSLPARPVDPSALRDEHDPQQRATRRTITTLVAEVSSPPGIGEALDLESAHRPTSRMFETMRHVVDRHGGTIEAITGDALVAMFGLHLTHEDDALRAVRAASEIREAGDRLNEEFGRDPGVLVTLRLGLSTGEVIAPAGAGIASLSTGDVVKVATGLAQNAADGEILLAAETYGLVKWAAEGEPAALTILRGRSEPIAPIRLLTVAPGVGGHAQRFDSPLIGRERELRLLESALEQAVADGTCHLFSLLGPAGVGKSRLVHEFLRFVRQDAVVLRGRCLPYGERVAFWPIAETIKQAAGIVEADDGEVVRAKIATALEGSQRAGLIGQRLAALVGVSEPMSTGDETFWAIRSAYETIARARPLVIVFDDLQWGESSFLDLIEFIADSSRGASILLLCIARPELIDARPGWGAGHFSATSVLLRPLADAEASLLLSNLLGGSVAPAAVERKILEGAEGNPLFVEEFLAMLRDEGVLRRVGKEWVSTIDLASVTTPASIMALLAARLDRLPGDERDLLERAAVVGKVFTREAVDALVEQEALSDVGRLLASLVRRQMIRPERSAPEAPDAYRFKHILIRDAAYASLPKSERVVLHIRLAGWLAELAQGELEQGDEVIGAHLEQAYRYRVELGPPDDPALTTGRMAAARLAAAGRRAYLWGDAKQAEDLLKRAVALLPAQDRQRLLLLVDLTNTFIERGEFAAARRANDELIAQTAGAGLEGLRWRATLAKLELNDYASATTDWSNAAKEVQAAIAFFEAAHDDQALGLAWDLIGSMEWGLGHEMLSRRAQERAVEHARRAGDVRREARSLVEIATGNLEGPTPLADSLRTAQELLEWARTAGHLWTEAIALATLGRFRAMVGEFDDARRLVEAGIAIYRTIGRTFVAAADTYRWIGLVEWFAGNPAAAEQALRRGYEELDQLGARGTSAKFAAELGRMLYLQKRFDEAFEYTQIAEAVDQGLGLTGRINWRGVRAMILAQRGDESHAIAVGQEAVALAVTSDMLWRHGRALEDLAEVLVASGRPDAAEPLVAQAIRLYEQKGVTVLARRANDRLHSLRAHVERA